MHLLTAFGDEPAKQTKTHSCVETSVCLSGVVHRLSRHRQSFGSQRAFGCSPPFRQMLAPRPWMYVCVCGMAAARLQQMRGPHVRIRQWHGGAAEPDHTSLSRFPLSRWRAAAGAPLPDNYQPSPQMETSVSPHRSRFLPLPPSTAPLYLGKALPTLTMCFVTAD